MAFSAAPGKRYAPHLFSLLGSQMAKPGVKTGQLI